MGVSENTDYHGNRQYCDELTPGSSIKSGSSMLLLEKLGLFVCEFLPDLATVHERKKEKKDSQFVEYRKYVPAEPGVALDCFHLNVI